MSFLLLWVLDSAVFRDSFAIVSYLYFSCLVFSKPSGMSSTTSFGLFDFSYGFWYLKVVIGGSSVVVKVTVVLSGVVVVCGLRKIKNIVVYAFRSSEFKQF